MIERIIYGINVNTFIPTINVLIEETEENTLIIKSSIFPLIESILLTV